MKTSIYCGGLEGHETATFTKCPALDPLTYKFNNTVETVEKP
jgi:hypothetical protein